MKTNVCQHISIVFGLNQISLLPRVSSLVVFMACRCCTRCGKTKSAEAMKHGLSPLVFTRVAWCVLWKTDLQRKIAFY